MFQIKPKSKFLTSKCLVSDDSSHKFSIYPSKINKNLQIILRIYINFNLQISTKIQKFRNLIPSKKM